MNELAEKFKNLSKDLFEASEKMPSDSQAATRNIASVCDSGSAVLSIIGGVQQAIEIIQQLRGSNEKK